jgi:ketosteroid isomerase-like protein
MKRGIVGIALAVATVVSLAFSQTKNSGEQSRPTDAEQTLRRIEQEVVDSLLRRDPSANQRYLAEDVVLTTPQGEIQDKKKAVADVTSPDLKLKSSRISNMNVRVHGNTAIVTYRTTDEGTYRGKSINGQHQWTDIFMNRSGAWQVVAGHGSPVVAP